MIKAHNVHKYYNDLHVLKGVDIHVKKGEIVSIVGASGAGKTTLLQLLGTLDRASEKEDFNITINSTNINSLNDKALAKFRNEHIGFIFQFHQLLPEFTALENVCLPAFIKGTKKAEAEKARLAAELERKKAAELERLNAEKAKREEEERARLEREKEKLAAEAKEREEAERRKKEAQDKLLAEKNKRYTTLIRKADEQLNNKEYKSAKNTYNSALAVFPDKVYPKEKIERRKKERLSSFTSYKIAYDLLPKDAALIFLHLNKTSCLNRLLKVIDQHGRSYTVNLDEMEFLVQKKAEPLLCHQVSQYALFVRCLKPCHRSL